MTELKIKIDEETLAAYQRYAQHHGVSVDDVLRKVLSRGLAEEKDWLEECFGIMDQCGAKLGGQKWRREDLYDV